MSRYELARYDAYKDSGVEWIGKTPVDWELTRNKDIFVERGKLSSYGTETLLTVSHITGVTRRSEKDVNMFMAESMDGYKICKKGDLVINTMWAWMGALGTCNESGICSPAYGVYMPRKYKPYYYRYFDYLYRTANVVTEMTKNSKGIVSSRLRLYPKEFYQIVTALPDYSTQKAIADFLDAKTAQIDLKIDLLTQKVTKYRELKQSLINETVTCGLDKTVAMKDSGVEWIGKVPEHWIIERIGTAFDEKREKVNDTDYPPLSVTMKGIVPQLDTAAKTDHNDNRKRVSVNDFVINSRSDRRGSSGVSELNGSVSVINIVLAPRKHFYGKYLHHLFRSYRFIEEFYRVGRGIVDDLWTTRYSVMKAIDFAFPDFEEQKAIADYLDEKTAHIDRIIETINTQIDKLKELRKTLINDVVTGKIKVAMKGEAV